jgi:selenocysteine-specific translation elongation factor
MSEVKEVNFIVGIFGESETQNNLIGQTLGSPGTRSDIQFYNRLDINRNQVFCALTPIDYPEKIKPFLQTLAMTKIHILVIDISHDLSAIIGEILVGMDLYHQLYQTHAIVVLTGLNTKNEWKLGEMTKKIRAILNTSSLRDTEILIIKNKEDLETIKDKVAESHNIDTVSQITIPDYSKVLIDHVFPVKGIGTVILGIVKKGEIHAGQMLELTGNESIGKKVIIRSIQKHDRNFKDAIEGDRVGIALKGNISPSEINRDNVLTTHGILKPNRKFKARVFLNQFYTPKGGKLIPGNGVQYYGIIDLKVSPFKITEGKELSPGESGIMSLEFDKNVYSDGMPITGIITELNRFIGKLRIVGHFTQVK